MTCIVGLRNGKRVYLGGDSCGIAGTDYTIRGDRKVFRRGEFVIGVCGSFRVAHILMHDFEAPPIPEKLDPHAYMVSHFVKELRRVLKEAGALKAKEGADWIDASFLVGFRNSLFQVEQDLQVGIPVAEFDSCGCGAYYALGAMDILRKEKPNLDPEKTVRRALATAERFSSGVRGPFHVISTEKKK